MHTFSLVSASLVLAACTVMAVRHFTPHILGNSVPDDAEAVAPDGGGIASYWLGDLMKAAAHNHAPVGHTSFFDPRNPSASRGSGSSNATARNTLGFGITKINLLRPEVPTCVVDVFQAGSELALAGMAIDKATKACTNQTTSRQQLECANTITQFFAFFLYSAEFLGGSAQECGSQLLFGDVCNDAVTNLLASLSQLAAAATGIAVRCKHLTDDTLALRMTGTSAAVRAAGTFTSIFNNISNFNGSAPFPLPDLQTGSAARTLVSIADMQQALMARKSWCILWGSEALEYIDRAGVAIAAAVRECNLQKLRTANRRTGCAADVFGVIEAFSFAGSSISFAISQCPLITDYAAECSAHVINVVASIAGVANAAASMKTCVIDTFIREKTKSNHAREEAEAEAAAYKAEYQQDQEDDLQQEARQSAFDRPGFHQPSYFPPQVNQPSTSQPRFNEPRFNEPSSHEPSSHEPSSHEPSSHEPSSHEPEFAEPEFAEPQFVPAAGFPAS